MWGLGAFIGWFQHNVLGNMPSQFHGMLDQAGQMVEHEAQRVLGTYEYNWTPLAAETVARKATGDSPGLETGEMRDSVYHTVTYANGGGGEVAVGSNLDKAVWFELGTSRGIPPRPWLSQAAENMAPLVAHIAGAEMHAFLQNGVVNRQFGYAEHKAAYEGMTRPSAWENRN